MSITLLPEQVQNQIAAGEVVERPASIVKELIENSLDAKATIIEVFIEEGGQKTIQIKDNGIGICPQELRLALTRHATSKIKTLKDLWSIQSFGFRGEALPSIASVSSFKIESAFSQNGSTEASMLQVEHGIITHEGPSGLHQGTVITVKDLFLTIPARLKFLKTPSTEQKKIHDLFCRIAMTTTAELSLYAQNKLLVKFPHNASTSERLCVIWPESITTNLIPFEKKFSDITVQGLTSPTSQTQIRSDRILLYVNGRIVQDKLLLRAIRDAYKGRLISSEYPQTVLFLTVPSESLDVNVHPAKTEVRFRDEQMVFSAVMSTLREALTKNTVHISLTNTEAFHPQGFWGKADQERILPLQKLNHTEEPFTPNNSFIPHQNIHTSTHITPESHEKIFQEYGENLDSQTPTNPYYAQKFIAPPCETQFNTASKESYASDPTSISPPKFEGQLQIGPYMYLGQLGNSYLLLVDTRKKYEESTLIILDQHAIHERVLITKFREQQLQKQSQILILPIQLTLHSSEKETLQTIRETLLSLGFAFSLQENILHVQNIPSLLTRAIATDFLKKALSGQKKDLESLWVSMGCKAAINAGLQLAPNEAAELITQWITIEEKEYCPHGRPCFVTWTVHDLNKLFKRK